MCLTASISCLFVIAIGTQSWIGPCVCLGPIELSHMLHMHGMRNACNMCLQILFLGDCPWQYSQLVSRLNLKTCNIDNGNFCLAFSLLEFCFRQMTLAGSGHHMHEISIFC